MNEQQQPVIRLEFIGLAEGAVTYRGPSGREYRAGRNSDNRYIDVAPGDVERLLALRDGKQPIFQRVDLSSAYAGNIQAPPPADNLDTLLAEQAKINERIAALKNQAVVPTPAQVVTEPKNIRVEQLPELPAKPAKKAD